MVGAKRKIGKLVQVEWLDAVSVDEWQDLEAATKLEPHKILTSGYMLLRDRHRVVVAASYDPERSAVSQILAIPRSWVTKIRVLE